VCHSGHFGITWLGHLERAPDFNISFDLLITAVLKTGRKNELSMLFRLFKQSIHFGFWPLGFSLGWRGRLGSLLLVLG
jgi:hypothetical protein